MPPHSQPKGPVRQNIEIIVNFSPHLTTCKIMDIKELLKFTDFHDFDQLWTLPNNSSTK